MDDKLIVVYSIGQHHKWWTDVFYQPQLEVLETSGLLDNLEFIDINISGGNQPLPFVPEKIRNIHYRTKPPLEMNDAMIDLWEFCRKNSGYKVLYFHSDGVTHLGKNSAEFKLQHLEYIHFGLIEQWKICTQLLDFYDCVGLNYTPIAAFGGDPEKYPPFYAPHFRGMFWWANSDYIASLNKNFLTRDVFWKRYLAEVWIGTNKPRYYSLFNSYSNNMDLLSSFYREPTIYDKEKILDNALNHLKNLTVIDENHCRELRDVYYNEKQLEYDNEKFFRLI